MTKQDYAAEAAAIVQAWAGCVDRLMTVAPVRAVMDETGILPRGHTTQPERDAIRAEARQTVARWLARDLALLDAPAPSEPVRRTCHVTVDTQRVRAGETLERLLREREGRGLDAPEPSEPDGGEQP